MTTDDPFLSGGGGLPTVKFPEIGATVTGQIIDARQRQDISIEGTPQTWPNGDPKMVWIFDLDTTGDGAADSSLFVKGNLYTVMVAAIKAAGIPTVGAKVKVTHHAVGTPKVKGHNPAKLFEVVAKAGPPLRPAADVFTDEEPF